MTPPLTLAQIAAQPEVLDDLPVPVLAAIIAHASAKVLEKATAPVDEDRLISVEEASAITGLSVSQIKKESRRWPFTRRPTPGRLLCSLVACRRYRESLRHRG